MHFYQTARCHIAEGREGTRQTTTFFCEQNAEILFNFEVEIKENSSVFLCLIKH